MTTTSNAINDAADPQKKTSLLQLKCCKQLSEENIPVWLYVMKRKEIERNNNMNFPIGTKVKVIEGAGLDSGREGVIVVPSKIPTNGRLIPQIDQGHYKPFSSQREAVIRDYNGEIFTMFWCCLEAI